jgi:hypothetical protein
MLYAGGGCDGVQCFGVAAVGILFFHFNPILTLWYNLSLDAGHQPENRKLDFLLAADPSPHTHTFFHTHSHIHIYHNTHAVFNPIM